MTKSNNKINFLIDFDSKTGAGHLIRSGTLGNYLRKKKFKVKYYLLKKYKRILPFSNISNFQFVNYDKILDTVKDEPVIIDSYYIDKSLEKKIFKNNKKTIIIDDKNTRKRYGSIIISPYPFKKKIIPSFKSQKILQGKKYLIIPEFIKNLKRKPNSIKNAIMINFGYKSDHIIKFFLKHYTFKKDFNYYLLANKKIKNNKNVFFFNKNKYLYYLSRVNLVYGSPGLSEIERKYLKIPSILFATSQDQIKNGVYYKKIYNNFFGKLTKKNIHKISKNKLIEEIIVDNKSKSLIDDKCLQRIYTHIKKIINE